MKKIKNQNKIIFFDFLYSKFGSFDDDFECIKQSIDSDCTYIKSSNNSFFILLRLFIVSLYSIKPNKTVFLSYKSWHLILFYPFTWFYNIYIIYHFIPKVNTNFHLAIIKLFCSNVKIGVYSNAVKDQFLDLLNRKTFFLAARPFDKKTSIKYLKNKMLSESNLKVFIPGIKAGVRKEVDVIPYINKIEKLTGKIVSDVFIQTSAKNNKNIKDKRITYFDKVPLETYQKYFYISNFVIIHFEDDYEVRSSAVVYDAIQNGCIILSEHHDIVKQYRYPAQIVTNLDNLSNTLDDLHNLSINDIPGYNLNESIELWEKFLCLKN